jgi:hypothetical protein
VAGRRDPGSNLGRAAINWDEAFQHFAALPPAERDYRKVAQRFGVSVRTVERHGRNGHWRARAAAIDAEAAAAAAAELAKDRAAKLADVEKLIEATYVSYAHQLRDGRVPIRPADLTRLHQLRRELWQDAVPEPAPPAASNDQGHDKDSFAHKLEVLRALQEAGALERLQQLAQETRAATESRDGP